MNIAGDFRDEIFFRPNFGFSADRSCAIGALYFDIDLKRRPRRDSHPQKLARPFNLLSLACGSR